MKWPNCSPFLFIIPLPLCMTTKMTTYYSDSICIQNCDIRPRLLSVVFLLYSIEGDGIRQHCVSPSWGKNKFGKLGNWMPRSQTVVGGTVSTCCPFQYSWLCTCESCYFNWSRILCLSCTDNNQIVPEVARVGSAFFLAIIVRWKRFLLRCNKITPEFNWLYRNCNKWFRMGTSLQYFLTL